jgi:signal transduction histidine kinase
MTIVLTLAFYFTLETALLQKIAVDEKRIAEEDLIRLKMALSFEEQSLGSKNSDWANWDDSYQFIQDNNTRFIETNLVPQAFSDLQINLMTFIDNSGSVVFGKAYNLEDMTEMPIDQTEIQSAILPAYYQNANSSQLEGFLKTSNGIILIVAHPILKSNYEGPAKGVLITGILLDASEIADLSKIVGLPISLCPTDETTMTKDFLEANSTLTAGTSPFCTSVTETEISAYVQIKDINSNTISLASVVDSRQGYIETKAEILSISAAIAMIGLIFSAVFYFSLDKFVLSRLSNLNDSVKKISQSSSLKERTQTKGNDEVSDLSRRINDLLEQISISQTKLNDYSLTLEKKVEEKKNELEEANKKIIKSERMAAIGELAGMIAHDLRNPLTGIKNSVYLLKKRHGNELSDIDKETMIMMDKAIDHAGKIINDLLDYSREMHLDYEECSPKSLANYSLLSITVPSQIKLTQSVSSSPKIWVDTSKIQRVFTNLAKNAIDAMPNGGSLDISSMYIDQNIVFSFVDTGSGMSQELIQKIFTPLFTTKAQGMGFGLSICKRIVEAYNGKIEVESILNQGTKFTIILPIKPQVQMT